jgi:hypothetical protein
MKNEVNEQLVNPQNELTAVQYKVKKAITEIAKDENFQQWISGLITALSTQSTKKFSKWELFKIVIKETIFNPEFFYLITTCWTYILELVYALITQDSNKLIFNSQLIDALADDKDIERFLKNLGQNQAAFLNAVAYINDLPQTADDKLLDKDFIASLVTFITANTDKFNASTVGDLGLVVLKRSQNKDNPDYIFRSNLEITEILLRVVAKTEGLGPALERKVPFIAKFLAEDMPLNGIDRLMDKESFKSVIVEVLSQEKISHAGEKVADIIAALKEQMDINAKLANPNFKIADIRPIIEKSKIISQDEKATILALRDTDVAGKISWTYTEKLAHLSRELLVEAPETMKAITRRENHKLLLSQFFTFEEKNDQKIYRLNPVGKFCVAYKLMPFSNNRQLTNKEIENWSISVEEAKAFNIEEHFNIDEMKKELFAEGENKSFLQALIGTIDPGTGKTTGIDQDGLNELFSSVEEISSGTNIFIWLQKLLQLANTNESVKRILVNNPGAITYLVKKISSDPLKSFGLSEKFIAKILPAVLRNESSIGKCYKLFSNLASANYTEMVGYAITLVEENSELLNILTDDRDIHRGVGNLMEALGVEIPIIKRYIGRLDLSPLTSKVMGDAITHLLPVALPLLSPAPAIVKDVTHEDRLLADDGSELPKSANEEIPGRNQLLEAIKTILGNSPISSGLAIDPRLLIDDQAARSQLIISVYLYATGQKSFDEISASLKVIGIYDEESLQGLIEDAKLNNKAFELCNRVLGLFKLDSLSETQRSTQESQLNNLLRIINRCQGSEDLITELKAAVSHGEISASNGRFLQRLFQDEYFNSIDKNRHNHLISKLKYELRVKDFESIGVTKDEKGLVVHVVNSDVFFYLLTHLGEIVTREELQEAIRVNIAVLEDEDIERLTKIMWQEPSTIPTTLADLSYRRKTAKSIESIQYILTSILVPIVGVIGEEGEQYDQLITTVKGLVDKIQSDPRLLALINKIIVSKGEDIIKTILTDKQALIDLFKAINEVKDRQLLVKIVSGIIANNIDSPQIAAAVISGLKIIEDPSLDGDLEVNLNFIIKFLQKDAGLIKFLQKDPGYIAEALKVFGRDIKIAWENEEFRHTLYDTLLSGAGYLSNEKLVERFKQELDTAQSLGAPTDVAAILRRSFQPMSVHSLSCQELGPIVFSNCRFDRVTLVNTDLSQSTIENSTFTKCNFSGAILPQKMQNVTFDLESFKSFITAAKAQKLNIEELLVSVKVTTNLNHPVAASLVYRLINFYGEELSQEILFAELKSGATLENTPILSYKRWKIFSTRFGVNSPKDLIPTLNKFGISDQLFKKFQKEITLSRFLLSLENTNLTPLEKTQYIFLRGMINSRSPMAEAQGGLRALEKLVKEENIEIINQILGNLFDFTSSNRYDWNIESYNISALISTLSDNQSLVAEIATLNEKQLTELTSIIKAGEVFQKAPIENLLAIIRSEKYEKLAAIADKLGVTDPSKRLKLYQGLFAVELEKLSQYEVVIPSNFNGNGASLKDSDNVSEILRDWYLLRAIGLMSPESARQEGFTNAANCFYAADIFNSRSIEDNVLLLQIAKDIMLKLSGDRYLSIPDRTHDLQRIYIAINNINALPPGLLKALSKLEIESLTTQIYNELCKISRYELFALGRAYYIPAGEEYDKKIQKIILVEAIILAEPTLSAYRNELATLDQAILEVIATNHKFFAEISAVDVKPGYIYNGSDRTIHDQLYYLNKKELQYILSLSAEQFAVVKAYCLENNIDLKQLITFAGQNNQPKDKFVRFVGLSAEISKRLKLRGIANTSGLSQEIANALIVAQKLDPIDPDIIGDMVMMNYTDSKQNGQEVVEAITVKLGQVGNTAQSQKDALKKGQDIAEAVFTNLSLGYYLGENAEQSQRNLSRIIASAILASGAKPSDNNIIIGKVVKTWAGFIDQGKCTGIITPFLATYSTKTSYNPVARCDERSLKMLESLRGILSLEQEQPMSLVR